MNRATATTIVLIIASWAIGALEGSVVFTPHRYWRPVRWSRQADTSIEPAAPSEDEPGWIVNYTRPPGGQPAGRRRPTP